MTLSDTQFDIQSDFCRELMLKLQTLVKGSGAFDLDEIEIHQIEFLIDAYSALHHAGLAPVFPDHAEAKSWCDRFATDSSAFMAGRDDQTACQKMRSRILDKMTKFHQLCFDFQ